MYEAHSANDMLEQECHLPKFIVHASAVDEVVRSAVVDVIEDSDRQVHLFSTALLYKVPKKFRVFYERDMDINRFEGLQPMGFRHVDSLVHANMS